MSAAVDFMDYSAGDSLITEYTVKDGAYQYKSPKSLAGAVVTWTIERRHGTHASELLSLASDDVSPQVEIINAAAGVVRVTLAAGAFTAVGDFHHKLRVDIGGNIETVAQGRFISR